ncbi:hypothetical protein, partial [Klebsiella pneumoniae]|uniref:hypothetical protein n=1 Tax=Klebsiella pneumoniae TaxID=573 RepID=UPI0040558E8C
GKFKDDGAIVTAMVRNGNLWKWPALIACAIPLAWRLYGPLLGGRTPPRGSQVAQVPPLR